MDREEWMDEIDSGAPSRLPCTTALNQLKYQNFSCLTGEKWKKDFAVRIILKVQFPVVTVLYP